MFLIGLGNPNRRYNRHNVGHRVVDFVLQFNSLFPAANTNVYMNVSGSFARKYRHDKLWVVHDDLEVPVGSVKWKYGGGTAGHNGLRDISRYIPDYGRIRVGIGRPAGDVAEYVLQDHPPEELEIMQKTERSVAEFIVQNQLLLDECEIEEIRKAWKGFVTR